MSFTKQNMEALANDNIFLLELLINDVEIFSKEDNQKPCIGFTFMKTGPFYIDEGEQSGTSLKQGKSILFSLTPDLMQKMKTCFRLDLALLKHQNKKECVGKTVLRLDTLFCKLLENLVLSGPPHAESMDRCFGVEDESGQCTGKVCSYLRITCFGKFIVTTFYMHLDDGSEEYTRQGRSCRDLIGNDNIANLIYSLGSDGNSHGSPTRSRNMSAVRSKGKRSKSSKASSSDRAKHVKGAKSKTGNSLKHKPSLM